MTPFVEATSTRNSVSILFSFRNEELNISELVRRTILALSNPSIGPISYELVFINDTSTDGSLELLRNLQKSNPITIVSLARRCGPSAGVLAGIAATSTDAVIYMDSDLQDPPELIPELIAKWKKGAEVVHTQRTARKGESLIKMKITRAAYSLIALLSEENAAPVDCGDFKLITRRVAELVVIHSVINKCACHTLQSLRRASALFVQLLNKSSTVSMTFSSSGK